ncbi:transcriptional regulator [Mastigocladopsis repens]|uniref:transcriptional regulator n=1 Tax=Mastigocladopsis repens TaxID=221287 RepID=UPI000303D6F5|nr:transcriptional regulator [Mastigocladopsis repens]
MQNFVTEETPLYQQLFDEMFDRFNLSAKVVAKQAGVSEVLISRFRKGKADLGTGKFLALLGAVPTEAREWYLSQLLGAKPGVSLRVLVSAASPVERVEILNLIGHSFLEDRKTIEPSELMSQAV